MGPLSSTIVMVGFAEALSAPEVVWSIVDAGGTVVAFARRGSRAAVTHSRYATVYPVPAPEDDVEGTRAALRELLESVARDGGFENRVVLPLDDAALGICRDLVESAGWTLAGASSSEAIDLALDKERQIEAAKAAGLDVPPTVIARLPEDLDSIPFGFPIIMRPALATEIADGRLRKGRNWICANAQELSAARTAWGGRGHLLVQPFVRGVGEGAFGLSLGADTVAWSAHRRLRMMNPHGSGSSACVSRPVEEALKSRINGFLSGSKWRGMFMVELLRTPSGQALFVEFNGRAWGSMALARRQRLEYPAWTVQLAIGQHPAVTVSECGSGFVCRNLGRELMYLLFVLRGRRSAAMDGWPSIWDAFREVLRPHRRSGVYNWRRSDWTVIFWDSYYTIVNNLVKSKRRP